MTTTRTHAVAVETIRRAFVEFLTIPTATVVVFLGLATATYFLDQQRLSQDWPVVFPGDDDAARSLLTTLAGGIITITSITFSLLLLAVQQGRCSTDQSAVVAVAGWPG
ncbi:DUF2254 family protein [Devosia sp. A449]